MSCSYDECPNEIRNSCKGCPKITYLCDNHSQAHEDETTHKLKHLNRKVLNAIFITNLKSKIENCIVEMVKNTEKVITALKKSSNKAINSLKETAKDIKKISEFDSFQFPEERISFLVNEVEQISADIKISTLSQINDLKQEVYEKNNQLVSYSSEITYLKQEVCEKNNQIASYKTQISDLQHEVYENDQKFKDIASLKRALANPEGKEMENAEGLEYLEFRKMDLNEKLEFVRKNWPFTELTRNKYYELLLSNDGKYLFRCE